MARGQQAFPRRPYLNLQYPGWNDIFLLQASGIPLKGFLKIPGAALFSQNEENGKQHLLSGTHREIQNMPRIHSFHPSHLLQKWRPGHPSSISVSCDNILLQSARIYNRYIYTVKFLTIHNPGAGRGRLSAASYADLLFFSLNSLFYPQGSCSHGLLCGRPQTYRQVPGMYRAQCRLHLADIPQIERLYSGRPGKG